MTDLAHINDLFIHSDYWSYLYLCFANIKSTL